MAGGSWLQGVDKSGNPDLTDRCLLWKVSKAMLTLGSNPSSYLLRVQPELSPDCRSGHCQERWYFWSLLWT